VIFGGFATANPWDSRVAKAEMKNRISMAPQPGNPVFDL